MSDRLNKIAELKKLAQTAATMTEYQYAELAKISRLAMESWANTDDMAVTTHVKYCDDMVHVYHYFNNFMGIKYSYDPAKYGVHDKVFTNQDPFFKTIGEKVCEVAQKNIKAIISARLTTKPAAKHKPHTPGSTVDDKTVLVLQPGKSVSDADYTYTGIDAESFSWAGISEKTKGTKGTFAKKSVKPEAWAKAVSALNALVVGQIAKVITTTTTAPTADGAQATTAPATQPADNLTANVAKIISNMNEGQTYGGKTLFRNEVALVRGMIAAINGKAAESKMTIDASLALAKVIVGMARTQLSGSTLDSATAFGPNMGEKEIESTHRAALDTIVRAVDILADSYKKDGYKGLVALVTIKPPAPVSPAITAPTPVATTASALEAKIIRLAATRRIRVRSQMENAIESGSTAQMGRSRA